MVIKRRGKDDRIRCEEFLTNHLRIVFLYTRPFITTGHASATCRSGTRARPWCRRIKAVCRWCHQHTVHPEPDAWLAANAVTDGQIEALCREAWEHSPLGAWQTTGIPMRYGTGIDWDEFHAPTEYHGTPDCPTTGHTIWPITQIMHPI